MIPIHYQLRGEKAAPVRDLSYMMPRDGPIANRRFSRKTRPLLRQQDVVETQSARERKSVCYDLADRNPFRLCVSNDGGVVGR